MVLTNEQKDWVIKEINKTRNTVEPEYFKGPISLKQYLQNEDMVQWANDLNKRIEESYAASLKKNTPELFKEEILLNNDFSWAINSDKRTKKKISITPAYTIFEKVKNMKAMMKNHIDIDVVIKEAGIPYIMGEAMISELVHRFYPDICPIKNRRSMFLYAKLPNVVRSPFEMAVSQFIPYIHEIGDIIIDETKCSKQNKYQLVFADRLAWLFTIDVDNNEAFKMFVDPRYDDDY